MVSGFSLLICAFALPFVAQAQSCEVSYFKADVVYNMTSDSRFAEFSRVFTIYSDTRMEIESAFDAAAPIFLALKTPPDERPELLQKIVWLMRTGRLCDFSGRPKTLSQVIEILR